MSEPSRAALEAIEAEWPSIAAGLEVVELECRLAPVPTHQLMRRANRRATRQLLALLAQHPDIASVITTNPIPASGHGRSGASVERN